MNLIINNISIISSETKKAKNQNFVKGINVVTSSGTLDGNWVGKSCMLRSIFHTLGAEGLFSDEWEKEGPYLYLLDFNINDTNYLMLRKNRLFKLFDFNRRLIFSVSDRFKLAEELVKIFNQKIYLKSHEGIYKLAHPAYNYLLNYIEQKKIEPTNFQSFRDLTAFKDYYSDLIYSHLGVNNDYSNKLKEKEKLLSIEKKEFEDREKTLNEMNKEIEISGGLVLELDVLRKKFQFHEQKYCELSNKINKHKQKLNNAYNLKVELENLLKEIDILMVDEKKDLKKDLKNYKCPHCNNRLSSGQSYYFHRVKYIDGYGIQKLSVENHLNEVKRKIEVESQHYKEVLDQIKDVEMEIFASSKEIKDGLKAIGLKEVATNIILKIGEARTKIQVLEKNIKAIKKELREIEKKKNQVDEEYENIFNEILLKYSITGIISSSIKRASNKIKVDGTHNNIITVAWLCSLLKTKYKFNPDTINYPLIFDTPNNANLDENNEKKIFKLIFDNLPKDGQIIVSLVGFEELYYINYSINKIVLKNQQYELLNNSDYIECKNQYSYLGLFD